MNSPIVAAVVLAAGGGRRYGMPKALVEYEATLKTNPGRFDALYGAAQAAEQAGKHDKANDYFAKLVKNCEGATSERAELKHAREILEARAAKN